MAKRNRESLLNLIRRLYTELFLVSLHNRIDSYHSYFDSDDHAQISNALYKFIDEIVQEASHNYTPIDYKTLKFLDAVNNSNASSLNHLHNRSTTMVSMTLNGLSLYLQRQKALENALDMSIRLQRCVWDHVHSAHRYARAANGRMAKLHADIACDAIKALSHYMPSEEYRVFFTEINNQITNTVVANKEISLENI